MWSKAAEVLETDLGDEIVLMHPGTSEMFSLNSAGRIIWTRLPAPEAQLVQELMTQFEIDEATAAQDVRALLEDLKDRALVHHEP